MNTKTSDKQSWRTFQTDLSRAKEVEKKIAEWFRNQEDVDDVVINNDYRFDLLVLYKNKTYQSIEVKTDYMAAKTGNVAIEYSSRNKDSGIVTSKADFHWLRIYEPDGNIYNGIIPTITLHDMVDLNMYHKKVNGGDKGSNSLCYLFTIDKIKEHCIQVDETI